MNYETEEGVLKKKATLSNDFSLFTPKSIRTAILASTLYLIISFLLIGFKTDQLILVGLFNTLYFASGISRRFILGFSIFIIYWIVFDYMKAFPNFCFNEVHIQDLYNWEKDWFGFNYKERLVTPNEFFALNTSTFFDILSGVFYLCWIPVPLAFAGILFFKNRKLFFQFSLTFFLVNIIGFIGYYAYPAAPPWYVSQYGFDFISTTRGNTAGLAKFDSFLGIGVFESIYAKSSNVFAAMPSLHAAYMLIVLYYSIKANLKSWNILFAVILVGIWFAAVYSGHHYVLDILAGVLCTVLGVTIFHCWSKSKSGKSTLKKLESITSR